MDIDIDFPTTFQATTIDPIIVKASQCQNNMLKSHPCGIYMQNIPVDRVTNLAAIPYKSAAELGFFKVDCLHLSVLDGIPTKQDVRRLAFTDPDWSLFERPDVVARLFQIHRHSELIATLKPRSVMELADCIALIRPGVQHLVDEYVDACAERRARMRSIIYTKASSGYGYKKPHAISYALTIILQLNNMCEKGMINIES